MIEKPDKINDDFDLLDRMMKDMYSAPVFYKPTNYWQSFEKSIIKYLKNNELEDFRSYDVSMVYALNSGTNRSMPFVQRYKNLLEFKGIGKSSIIATMLEIYGRVLERMGRRFDLLNIKKFFDHERYYMHEFRELQDSQYRHSKLLDKISGLNVLDSIEDSSIGNPFDLFRINGRQYTLPFLKYFDQMTHVMMNKDIKSFNSVIEIGSGYGGSCEVYVKSFPHITYFNFDIIPSLYVSQQYLSSVFPGQVYTYKNFISGEKIALGKYRIFCLPSWALKAISDINFDLFINASSFQEMEPDVVENYYNLIKERVKYVYLFQLIHGTYKKTSKQRGGCLEPLKIDDFPSIFKDFEILDKDNYYRTKNPYAYLFLKKLNRS